MKKRLFGIAIIASIGVVIVFLIFQVSLFVIQPIGAIPKGRTLLIWRLNTMHLVDSPDGWCQRRIGGVSLLCRAAVLSQIAKKDVLIASFPYSDTLYLISTKGRRYSN